MKIYADTTLLAAYYMPEPASRAAEMILRYFPPPLVSELAEAELDSLLAAKTGAGELSPADADQVRTVFQEHLEEGCYQRLPLEPCHYDLARAWLAAPSPPLRPFDALHLAVASLSGATLATTDRELARAGQQLGVAVLPVEETTGWTLHERPAAVALAV